MNRFCRSLCLLSVVAIGACGGSGDIPGLINGDPVNVAASVNGAQVSSTHNSSTANHLIDGDTATSWSSSPTTPIVVTFAGTEYIRSITLTRVASEASLGATPDILVELSSNGTDYKVSQISGTSGTVSCTQTTSTTTSMSCSMRGHNTRSIRITSQNDKAYSFTELTAIAYK